MITLPENLKTEFYRFLNGNLSILEIERFIYEYTELEYYIEATIYFELINFDFSSKISCDNFKDFILKNIIEEGQFETWKLKKLLSDFIAEPQNAHVHLNSFYHLYCGIYQENAPRKYEYKFLANLGLNYLYWIDEGYMKVHYGENWKREHEKALKEVGHYQYQLKPFAEAVLEALNNGKIMIHNDGKYSILEDVKTQLILKKIYNFIHPKS